MGLAIAPIFEVKPEAWKSWTTAFAGSEKLLRFILIFENESIKLLLL